MKTKQIKSNNNTFLPTILLSSFLVILIILVSCSKKENPSPPSISAFELGYQNSHTASIGSDLHLEAEILAEGKIQHIILEIHPEGAHEDHLSVTSGTPWEVDTIYTGKYSGVKNTSFHEHLDIPATADTGSYHVHFIVTDMEGNQTSLELELRLLLPSDTTAPIIQVITHPNQGQVFLTGDTIRITGQVTDNIAIGGLYIALVAEDQNLPDSLVNHLNTITLLHTHEFPDPANVSFEAELRVGVPYDNDHPDPKPIVWGTGNYYLVIKSPDAFGGNVGYSVHFPIIIN